MKVLHLTAGNLYGGIETFLTTLARLRHLVPAMEPEFGLCFRGRPWDELESTGVPMHEFGPVRLCRPWTVWRARRALVRVLASTLPDAVVVHGCWPHAVFAPVVRQAGIRLVHFIHGEVSGRNWLERWAARTPPDLAVANSRFTAGSVNELFPQVPVESWYIPVPQPAVEALARSGVRDELGTPDETVVILQASRLERWKGQAAHLAALALLKNVPGWECWLAGGVQRASDAEFLMELQVAAERAGIASRIRFLGQRADVPRLMAAADVFCQPNVGPEPFGIVFVEALHSCLPVVTSGFGGAAEIVNEACGILTTPGDAAAVAAALRSLVEDSSLRKRLGTAGPHRAETLCDPAQQLDSLTSAIFSGCGVIRDDRDGADTIIEKINKYENI